jgi:hypothetical protein
LPRRDSQLGGKPLPYIILIGKAEFHDAQVPRGGESPIVIVQRSTEKSSDNASGATPDLMQLPLLWYIQWAWWPGLGCPSEQMRPLLESCPAQLARLAFTSSTCHDSTQRNRADTVQRHLFAQAKTILSLQRHSTCQSTCAGDALVLLEHVLSVSPAPFPPTTESSILGFAT